MLKFNSTLRLSEIFFKFSQTGQCTVCEGPGGKSLISEDFKLFCPEHITSCSRCKHPTGKISDNLFYNGSEKEYVCKNCQIGEVCPECHELLSETRRGIYKNKRLIGCEECQKQCESCNLFFPEEDVTFVEDDAVCETCLSEYFTYCKKCESTIKIQYAIEKEEREYNRNTKRYDTYTVYYCDECADKCESCSNGFENDELITVYGSTLCEECFSENFIHCEQCSEPSHIENSRYDEYSGEMFCEDCYDDIFAKCESCDQDFRKSEGVYRGEDFYCDDCAEKLEMDEVPEELEPFTRNLSKISFNSNSRYLQILKRIVPISVKDLKSKYPELANAAKDLIIFSGGKDITPEILMNFKESQEFVDYDIDYSVWDSGLQRSFNQQTPQLVLNIKLSDEQVSKLKEKKGLYELFDMINDLSARSEHPYKKDQLGWARLEINEEEKYILVDEIQTDHMNVVSKLSGKKYANADIHRIRAKMKERFGLSEEEFDQLLNDLKEVVKPFPDIALNAISEFARNNNFNKLYYHTYESGKKLKYNSPPKSLYTQVPKKNFFRKIEEKPFGLDGEFFARRAKRKNKLLKIANYLSEK